MKQTNFPLDRRSFLKYSGSCGAYLAALMTTSPVAVRQVFSCVQENEKLFERDWGWIEKLSDNIWSHIATPFENGDFTTVCNGGIIAGKERVLAIESFQKPEGAKWLAERCKELTGRWPTDVVLTHFHGDHVSGSQGYQTKEHSPKMWITAKTKELLEGSRSGQSNNAKLLENQGVIPESESVELDLGNQLVKLVPMSGHTPSDVIIEVADPNVVFCGDLFWNRLVPNFRDSSPRQLTKTLEDLVREDGTTYVPGHGTLSKLDDVKRFQRFLEVMEDAAKKSHSAGKEAKAAASEFKLEGEFADWYVFADSVIPAIFAAWYRELGNKQ